ncbi:S1 family peptidase [Gracilibacillus suaedae]|uniref:S1 family peptidase n=1 Tax=Gracilibacillus suaedae TaxID=2820273 RepID=UPI001ABEB9D7|nr:S1 family peptidase [Gracilibacillus suaedae]
MKKIVLFFTFFLLSSFVYGFELDASENIPSNNEMVEKNVAFREQFGLNSHENRVKDIVQNSSSKEKYGYFFTEEEFENLNSRIAEQESSIPQIKRILGSDYTLFIDQKNGGITNIGTKESIKSSEKNQILSLFEDDDKINFYNVNYTSNDLTTIVQEISEDRKTIASNYNIEILGVSSDIQSETIDIQINEPTDKKVNILQELYGKDLITVSKGYVQKNDAYESNRFNHPGYIFGGAAIAKDRSESTSYTYADCSAGFTARSYASPFYYYVITAGHCADSSGQNWYQGGTFIGDWVSSKDVEDGNVDAGAIHLSVNTSNWVAGNGNTQHIQLNNSASSSEHVEGRAACISGMKSGTNCGIIEDSYSCATFDNGYFCGVQTDYTAVGGDSGATVFTYYNNTLLGIHKGGTTHEWYSRVNNVAADLNITPLADL